MAFDLSSARGTIASLTGTNALLSNRSQISSKWTLELETAAQQAKNRANLARVLASGDAAIQDEENKYQKAMMAWEDSYRTDQQLGLNEKKAKAQRLKDTLKFATGRADYGQATLDSMAKDAESARIDYESALEIAQRRLRDHANVSVFHQFPTISTACSKQCSGLAVSRRLCFHYYDG